MTINTIREYGNELVAFMSDGSRVVCYPTMSGMWIPRIPLIEVTPVDLTKNSSDIVTIPTVTGVQYRKEGVNVANSSTHTITTETDFDAIAKPGYKLSAGIWSWTFEPSPSSDFKFPFPRNQHTTYPGHSGTDWPGGVVGNDADVHVIGAGTVVERYAYADNTYGQPGGANEPVWRGNCLVIDHGTIAGQNIRSLYAHMRDAPSLSVSDTVTAGQVIGRVGNTGFSDGAHLHHEIIVNGTRRPQDSVPSGYTVSINWLDANAVGSWA